MRSPTVTACSAQSTSFGCLQVTQLLVCVCALGAGHGLGRAPIEDTLTEVMQALDDLIRTVEHSSSSSGSYGHNKAHSEHNASQSSKLCFHDLEGGMEYEIVWTEAGRQSWFRVHVMQLSADEAVLRYLDTGEQETLHREEWTPGCLRNKRAITCRPKTEPSHPRAELPNDTDTDTARYDQGTQFTVGPAGIGDDRPVSRFTGVSWEARFNCRGKWKAQIEHEKQKHHLGCFDADDEEGAARAYDAAARRLRGAQAHGGRAAVGGSKWRLNFPTDFPAEQHQSALPTPARADPVELKSSQVADYSSPSRATDPPGIHESQGSPTRGDESLERTDQNKKLVLHSLGRTVGMTRSARI
jgi:hypothetical protein